MNKIMSNALAETVLQTYKDVGIDTITVEEPQDLTQQRSQEKTASPIESLASQIQSKTPQMATPSSATRLNADSVDENTHKAATLSKAAKSLEELQQAIQDFDGLSVRNTAMNMVFSDGNPESKVMIIGEAPNGDEDRMGKPFVGKMGQLFDKMMSSIGLDRNAQDPKNSVYISTILNWRPPGNRTPTPEEIQISLPFIKRHIELIDPDILILMGGVSGKALTGRKEGITKLRGQWIPYTLENNEKEIEMIATFHPAYLLRSPDKKAKTWQDLLSIKAKLGI